MLKFPSYAGDAESLSGRLLGGVENKEEGGVVIVAYSVFYVIILGSLCF